jgi:hypothetical protein
LAQESIDVSAQDYCRFLHQQYQGLQESLKDMMTFDYFEQPLIIYSVASIFFSGNLNRQL